MTRRSARRSSEAGSAYIVVLLALVVLTIVGLSVAFITQTEVQLGGSERLINQVFYAADSGLAVITARGLIGDYGAVAFLLPETGAALVGGSLQRAAQVETSPFLPITDGIPCNLCSLALGSNAGNSSGTGYNRVNHWIEAQAERFATSDGGTSRTPIAQSRLSANIELQPWRNSESSMSAIIAARNGNNVTIGVGETP